MTKPSAAAKALTAVFVAVCVLSAAVQYNDPDPLRWIAMYLACGVGAGWVLLDARRWPVAALAGVIAAAWALVLWAGVGGQVETSDLWKKMSEKGGRVEEMREAGGLTIVAVGALWAAWAGRKRAGKRI